MSELITGFAIGVALSILFYVAYQGIRQFQEESKIVKAMKEKQTKLNVIRKKKE